MANTLAMIPGGRTVCASPGKGALGRGARRAVRVSAYVHILVKPRTLTYLLSLVALVLRAITLLEVLFSLPTPEHDGESL